MHGHYYVYVVVDSDCWWLWKLDWSFVFRIDLDDLTD
jgi:hypothetical protein